MKFFVTAILLFSVLLLSAQQEKTPLHHLQISAGRCTHSTGDLRGLIFTTEYSQYCKKRISWSIALSGTIHDGTEPIYFALNGEQTDGSIRYTVAGVQLAAHIGYSLLHTAKNELKINLGPLLRYQSSSLADYANIHYPAGTGLPYPVVLFIHTNPQKTYSAGGSLQLRYNYTFNKKFTIGALAGLQADSEGENLFQTSLSIGMRL